MGVAGGLLFLRGAVHSHLEHSIQVRRRSPLSRLPCPTPLRSCFSRFFSNRDLPIACPAGTHIPAGRQGGVGRATSAPGMDWGTLPPQGTQFPDTSQVQGKDVRAAPGTPNREAVSQESGDPGYPPAKCWFFPCDGRESIWSHWPVSYSCGSFCNKKHF